MMLWMLVEDCGGPQRPIRAVSGPTLRHPRQDWCIHALPPLEPHSVLAASGTESLMAS